MRSKVGIAAVAAVLVLGDLVLPRHGWGVPLAAFGALSALLMIQAVRRYGPANPLPWYVMILGLSLFSGGFVFQSASGSPALDLPAASDALILGGLACEIVSFTLFVRARTRVLDRYQLLDIGVVVVSASLAFSQLVLDPSMDARPPVGISRGMSTLFILLVLVSLGLAARFITLPGRRGRAAWCLVAIPTGSVAASVILNLTSTDTGSGPPLNLVMMFLSAVIVIGARHPSMVELTEPAEGEAPTFGVVRLGGLGVALFLTPLTAVLVHARTGELHPLTILAPGALVTVLVMGRLRLLFARERSAREEVDASREAFSALIHGISDVITVVDGEGTVTYASQSAAKALGRSADELLGVQLTDLFNAEDAAQLAALLVDLPHSGRTVKGTVRLSVGGTDKVFELEASDHYDNIYVTGLIVVLHDATARHLLEGELRHQALHDTLTGLANRKLFIERVRATTDGGEETSVLFVDLDDFKDVNDGLGHQAGDALLKAVAGRLQRACRDGDTVARLGGDEFAVLVVDHQDRGAPQTVARRVLEVLEQPFEVAGQRVVIGASVGIASGRGLSDEELLRHADVAMYRAKAAGKGTLALFEPGMEDAATERLSLHIDLAEGLTRGEFRVLYQPIFDLATGELRGGEALVRWIHPTLGLLTPDRFLGLAEDTGLIVPLGQWVLEEACRQAGEWPEHIGIAVNLSARQLEHDSLIDDVARTVAASGIRPARLVLEITESVVAYDRAATVQRLGALRALGVRIAIDDFGTGYSSLSSLLELPIDMLKVDNSFVGDMLERPEASALIQVVIEMGRTLGIEVVAEGIEDVEQAVALQHHRCHQGQGFLYSEPVDAVAFAAFLGHPEDADAMSAKP